MATIYNTGTVSVTAGGTTVTGVGTTWIGSVFAGDLFTDPAQGMFARVTADAVSNTSLSIAAWPGTTMSGDAYEILLWPDSVRSSERARRYAEIASQIANTGIGIDAFGDFTDRATYNTEATGFAFLSFDGDGASITDPVIFLKNSSASADWSAAVEITGPQGAQGETGLIGVWEGPWLTSTAYAVGDAVSQGGSSYICLEAHTSGTFSTDLAASKWEIVAQKGDTGATGANGVDGTGLFSRVRAVAVSNITIATALNDGDSLDGVTLATNDLVLVAGQTAPEENGVYVVGASPARDSSFDAYDDHPGVYISVMEGTTYADTLWRCTSDKGGTIGSTALVFATAFSRIPSINGGPLSGFRNKIINGDFDVWQRGTSFSANGYGPDRWYLAGGGTFTVTLQTTGVPLGATNVCRIAYGASSSFCNIRQALESSQVNRLKGKMVTLGVMVRRNSSFAANLSLILEKNATANTMLGGTWSAISSVSVGNALLPIGTGKTDWYLLKMTAAIPDDGTANGLRISIAEGSVGGSGAYWELGHVYIVEGNATAEADPFSPRHVGQELALCQFDMQEDEYDLFLAMGQSNMVGSGTGGAWPSNNQVRVWDGRYSVVGSTANPLTSALNGSSPFNSDGSNNLAVNFVNLYQRLTGRRAMLVLMAKGGTSITEMNQAGGEVWDGMISNMAALFSAYPGATLKGFLWHQGEADQFETNAWYIAEFQTLLDNLRAEDWFPADTPIVVGETYFGTYSGARQWKQNNALSQLPYIDEYVACASSAGLEALDEGSTDSYGADYRVHFIGEDLVVYGKRYLERFLSVKNGGRLSPRFNVAARVVGGDVDPLQASVEVVAAGGTLNLTIDDIIAPLHIKCSGSATINLPDINSTTVSSWARALGYRFRVFCNVNSATVTINTGTTHTIAIGNGSPATSVSITSTRAPVDFWYGQDTRWRGIQSA